jgi:uncharacterized membrane protein
MKKTHMFKKIAPLALMAALLPNVANAQQAPPTTVTDFGDIVNIIERAAAWLYTLILAIAVVMLLYAAFLYLTAAGNDERIGKAKSIILYVVIAIIVAVVANGLISIVQSFFGA